MTIIIIPRTGNNPIRYQKCTVSNEFTQIYRIQDKVCTIHKHVDS